MIEPTPLAVGALTLVVESLADVPSLAGPSFVGPSFVGPSLVGPSLVGASLVGPSLSGALPLVVESISLRYAYVTFAVLLSIGLYIMIASPNLVKKIIGLNMFQSAIFLFFVSMAYVEGAAVPVVPKEGAAVGEHASPLPQVIVLTAIVVGVSLTAVALALVVRIYAEFGTLREDTIREVTDE